MSSLLRQEMEKTEVCPPSSESDPQQLEGSPKDNENKNEEEKCSTYIVQAGDTLMRVSLKTNISIPLLKKFNRLYGRNSLCPGQVLQLTNPALQPTTWTDSSHGVNDGALIPLASTEKNVSFIEKQRLKSKSISSKNLENKSPPPPDSLDSSDTFSFKSPPLTRTPSSKSNRPGSLKVKSSSFKYKCNSNPDLKSMAEQNSSPTPIKQEPVPVRRQSLARERLPGSDWGIFTKLEDTPHDTVISTPSQPNPSGGESFSLSSVPKALLLGSMHILDSYFNTSQSPVVDNVDSNSDNTTHAHDQTLNPSTPRHLRSFHTQLHGNSSILLHSHIHCLVEHFPTSIQHEAWELLYSTELHGSDLASFYHRSAVCSHTLIVVRTEDHQIFGGFATEPWKVTKHGREAFYGTGECFLYRCHPSAEGDEDEIPENDNVDVFPWQYDNYFFQWSNARQIAMGGGGGHFGFVLDDDFAYGETNPCETFGNPYLTSHTEPFAIEEVELWGFGDISALATLEEGIRNREHKYMMNYKS